MTIKICGHKIDWQKPIKNYNIFKLCLCAMFLMFVTPATSFAGDQTSQTLGAIAPSSGVPSGCDYVAKGRPHSVTNVSRHQQRGAPAMSPAFALALALGVRNIAGPMERSPASKKEFATSSTSFDRRTPLMPQGKGDTPVIPTQIRLPRPEME